MTRPEIVRADTLDLQDHNSPSASDHTRQPASPRPLGDGPPAPHQAQSLRRASLDGHDLHVRSPRGSKDFTNKELKLLHDPDADDQDGAGEGGQGHDGEHDLVGQDLMDDDDDDELDDDMMDKISSSPSIDDGGYTSQTAWPRRGASLVHHYSHINGDENVAMIAGEALPELGATSSNDHWQGLSEEYHHGAGVAARKSAPEPCHRSYMNRTEEQVTRSRLEENLEKSREDDKINESGADQDVNVVKLEDLLLDPGGLSLGLDLGSDLSGGCGTGFADSSNSGNFSSDDDPLDAEEDEVLWADERFVDSGWGGECLREIEDIDFEFVYALHTFVATVEGQANATKGDTMVLLDDSNSYWWLVKVVKDNSIGYLPAEHIETPTERLARLNKHRNIDLSQTMLGDNPEKSRNPLKIAMRRRNAKTVQFTDPTYYEPSDVDYSSDEEEEEDEIMASSTLADSQIQSQAQSQQEGQMAEDESATVEPLKPRDRATGNDNGVVSKSQEDSVTQVAESDKPRSSQDTQDSRDDEGRKGLRMRNTDSFYKDDSVETRKISLTPGILRDTSSAPVEESRASLDSQKSNEKPATNEKPKKEKKEKKGMLGGLFKRKNSKSKHEKEEEKDDLSGTTVSPHQSFDSASLDSPSSTTTVTSPQGPKSGKLQKSQPPKSGSLSKRNQNQEEQTHQKAAKAEPAEDVSRAQDDSQDQAPGSLRQARQDAPAPLHIATNDEAAQAEARSPTASKGGLFSPIQTVQTMLSNNSANADSKPEKVKKAKNRMALEDSDISEDETGAAPGGHQASTDSALKPSPYSLDTNAAVTGRPERLSESPIEVSPVVSSSHLAPGQSNSSHPGSSHLDVPPSPVSAVSTPELVERPGETEATRSGPAASAASKAGLATGYVPAPVATKTPDAAGTPSTSTMSSPVTAPTTPQWSPAALRAYLDSNGANDVRDLILLVNDTSNFKGLPQHHEIVKGFDGERIKLDGMQKRLDGLLGDVLSRRSAAPMGMI